MKLATYQTLGYSLTAPIAFFACKNLYGQITNGRYKFKAQNFPDYPFLSKQTCKPR